MVSPYHEGLTFGECCCVIWMRRTSLKLVNIMTTSLRPWMKYIGWVMGESRKYVAPFGQQLAVKEGTRLPESAMALFLRSTSRAQGCRMGLERSAMRWV